MTFVAPPRWGPCQPWATEDDVSAYGGIDIVELDPDLLDTHLQNASELLWNLFGQQFNGGGCQAVLRPITRLDLGVQSLMWWQTWGYSYVPDLIAGNWYNFGGPWGYGLGQPPPSLGLVWEGGYRIARIDLGQYPVTGVAQVKIDGVVQPISSYRLDEWRYLTRVDGEMWPINQDLLLDDNQVNTWSVAIQYGQPPPKVAVTACAQLAAELVKHQMGDLAKCQLPLRVTSMSRQGVTYSLPDVMAILKTGKTGLYFVDLAIQTLNPNALQRPARVLTYDLKPYRRIGSLGG